MCVFDLCISRYVFVGYAPFDIVEWSIWNAVEEEWNLKYGVVSNIKNEIRGNRLVSVSKVIPLNDSSTEIDFFTLSLRLISQTSDMDNEKE